VDWYDLMNTTYLALLILLIVYVPFYIYVRKSDKMAAHGIVPYGPLVMFKTKWGLKTMDRLSKHKRFWGIFGLISKVMSLILMIFIVMILVIDLILIPSAIGKGGVGIEYALAIPGLNPMLPLVYGVIGLIIAMVIHEMAHGIQTRANDMDVDSSGILYGVVPLGAFVEPNNEQVMKCSRKARMDLYSAGIATNFIASIVLFILMFACLSGGLTTEYGDNPAISAIVADSPGDLSDIPATAIIVNIDGNGVSSMDDLNDIVSEYRQYSLTYTYKNDTETTDIMLGTYINGVVSDTPASKYLEKGMFILSMENVTQGGSVVTIGTNSQFTEFMSTTDPNDVVRITTDTSIYPFEITLSENNGIGYLGVSTSLSGMTFTTPDKTLEGATNPFSNCDTVSSYALATMNYIGGPFAGYSPIPESTQWWFDSSFLPDDVFWIIISVIFWTFWLNLVLGISNALPAVPFDGGFLFMGGMDFILEKTGMRNTEKRENVVNRISSFVTYATLLILILVMVVVIF